MKLRRVGAKFLVVLFVYFNIVFNGSFFIEEQLEAIYLPNFETSLVELLKNLTTYCNKPFYEASERDLSSEPVMWTFFRTFLFVVTVVTTVGKLHLFTNLFLKHWSLLEEQQRFLC